MTNKPDGTMLTTHDIKICEELTEKIRTNQLDDYSRLLLMRTPYAIPLTVTYEPRSVATNVVFRLYFTTVNNPGIVHTVPIIGLAMFQKLKADIDAVDKAMKEITKDTQEGIEIEQLNKLLH